MPQTKKGRETTAQDKNYKLLSENSSNFCKFRIEISRLFTIKVVDNDFFSNLHVRKQLEPISHRDFLPAWRHLVFCNPRNSSEQSAAIGNVQYSHFR